MLDNASFVLAAALCAAVTMPNHVLAVRPARTVTSHAVLHAEHPCVHGWSNDTTVEVSSPAIGISQKATVDAKGAWTACFGPQKPSFSGVDITLKDKDSTVTLQDILFGDVWVCSGQSNMEFSVAETFDADNIIRTASIDGLRLFAVQKNSSSQPVEELIDVQEGWVLSSPETICGSEYSNNRSAYCLPHCGGSATVPSFARPTWGYFSAVCFIHGRRMLELRKRPQGLVESCWGGTRIESWSSPDALSKCKKTETLSIKSSSPFPFQEDDFADEGPSTLYNSMIVPLLKTPVTGFVWYQGEANSGQLDQAKLYACQMNAMIEDWRARWLSSGNATFVMAQLAAYSGSEDALPVLRWSQHSASVRTARTAYAVGTDLFDPESPCGNVHIRNKTAVGERLAEETYRLLSHDAGRDSSVPTLSPLPTKTTIDGDTLTMEFESDVTLMAIPQTNSTTLTNFEILTQDNQSIPIEMEDISAKAKTVTIQLDPSVTNQVHLVRHAWSRIPSGVFLYDAKALLPAAPFELECQSDRHRFEGQGSTSCRYILE